eukprot:scaffold15_cov354-Prasinococcus_capsulatus_cf.AAC.4
MEMGTSSPSSSSACWSRSGVRGLCEALTTAGAAPSPSLGVPSPRWLVGLERNFRMLALGLTGASFLSERGTDLVAEGGVGVVGGGGSTPYCSSTSGLTRQTPCALVQISLNFFWTNPWLSARFWMSLSSLPSCMVAMKPSTHGLRRGAGEATRYSTKGFIYSASKTLALAFFFPLASALFARRSVPFSLPSSSSLSTYSTANLLVEHTGKACNSAACLASSTLATTSGRSFLRARHSLRRELRVMLQGAIHMIAEHDILRVGSNHGALVVGEVAVWHHEAILLHVHLLSVPVVVGLAVALAQTLALFRFFPFGFTLKVIVHGLTAQTVHGALLPTKRPAWTRFDSGLTEGAKVGWPNLKV